MAEGEIDNLTMEHYLALAQGNQAPGVVKLEIRGNVNFEIKSQFMRELREDTFFGNKNDDAHEHVERVLDIISLFNILEVSHDAVMLRVFPITLTGAAKRWVDRLPPGTVNSWDLLKKTFIQRNIESSGNSKGIAAIVNKLKNIARDMKKLKENVHAIQVGCKTCEGAHLYKDCPLNEEVKGMEENVNFNVDPYEPPIPFPKRLEHHAEEALVHQTMKRLKKIKINRPLLKEIRQTDNYAMQMKYLVENKPRIEEDNEITMNPGCFALLQNHLPPKEQDPESFILPCSIGKLDFKNSLADLGASISISIMPFSIEDEDDLDGILDYLKPISYDGFINLDDEAYNKRRCRLLGMTYEEPTPILIEKAKVTRYTIGLGETYTKVKGVMIGLDYRLVLRVVGGNHCKLGCPARVIGETWDRRGLEYGRYGVSKVLDMAYRGFLGVETTHRYAVFSLMDTAYWLSEQYSLVFTMTMKILPEPSSNKLCGRYKRRCCSLIPVESDSLPHAHAQASKTYNKHQDSRIKKAQVLKIKTSATLILKIFLKEIKIFKTKVVKRDVWGSRFLARDITFWNTARAELGQVVAFLSGSDKSACYIAALRATKTHFIKQTQMPKCHKGHQKQLGNSKLEGPKPTVRYLIVLLTEQLNQSESWKKRVHEDAEEAKKQLAKMSEKLQESEKQLDEISASEESRLQELRKISQDRDRKWESELEAVQKHHSMDSAALASAMNEIQKLKIQLEKVSKCEATQAKYVNSAHDEMLKLTINFYFLGLKQLFYI
nr:hypothetical protein [Tanacetum cinerariifolium]